MGLSLFVGVYRASLSKHLLVCQVEVGGVWVFVVWGGVRRLVLLALITLLVLIVLAKYPHRERGEGMGLVVGLCHVVGKCYRLFNFL